MNPEQTVITMSTTNTTAIGFGSGWASSTVSDGAPETTEPIHFKNHANEQRDSMIATITITNNNTLCDETSNPPANIMNLLKNGPNGGSPPIAKAPNANAIAKSGIFDERPWNFVRSRVPIV